MRFALLRTRKRVAATIAVGAAAVTAGALLTAPADAASSAAPAGWTQVTSATGSGPHAVTVATTPGLPDHTIYMPADLSNVSAMPIFAWGDGACVDWNGLAPNILEEIASWGFLVVADGQYQFHIALETQQELTQGIDWAIAQNSTAGSPLRGKIATKEVGVGGFSCGGLEALHVATDPRVKTTVAFSSGLFANHATQLAGIHGSIAWIEGGPYDIAYNNGLNDFNAAPAGIPLLFASYKNSIHGGTIWPVDQKNGGPSGEATRAWLQFQLQGNPTAAKEFTGPQCGLCTNPAWLVKQRDL